MRTGAAATSQQSSTVEEFSRQQSRDVPGQFSHAVPEKRLPKPQALHTV
jgi:hypothetical protein